MHETIITAESAVSMARRANVMSSPINVEPLTFGTVDTAFPLCSTAFVIRFV